MVRFGSSLRLGVVLCVCMCVMQSYSNICCKLVLKDSLRTVRKGSQFFVAIHDHCWIFTIFS